MKQLSAAAVERAMKLQGVMLRAMDQADHLVSSGGDAGHQLPADAALADTLQAGKY